VIRATKIARRVGYRDDGQMTIISFMAKLAAGLASLIVVVCTASLAAPAATGCSFTGAKWQADGKKGTRYAVTVVRGVTCAQAVTLVRPLTHKPSRGPQTRVAAPRGWLCLSFSPSGARVESGACARLGKRVAWEPTGGAPVGGKPDASGGGKPPAGGGKPPTKEPQSA
jgi:hypothetical protein